MLVGADAGGQDLGNRGIGDGREAPVDRARGIGVPLVGHIAEGHDKGVGPVLVVDEVLSEVARLYAAEGHGHAAGKADGEDRLVDVRAEGDEPRRPADLDARLDELLGKPLPAVLSAHEDVEVLFLQLEGDLRRRLRIGRRADDGRKAGRGAVHELDAPLSEDQVVRGAQPESLPSRMPSREIDVLAIGEIEPESSRYRMASIISSAKKVAIPASRAGAR